MAGPRQPIELVIAKGKKNLTKAEIEARRASEVQPCTDGIAAPAYLTAAQKKHFNRLAAQLQKIKILGETDSEQLARYVTAETLYEQAVKDQRTLAKDRPDRSDPDYYVKLELWYKLQDSVDRRQDKYFKQATTAARELGLTISSRCKLQVPVKEKIKPVNKFERFGVKAVGSND